MQIENLISKPMEELRFKDFASLKVGKCDKFTRLRLPALQDMVSVHTFEAISTTFESEKDQATCLRWHLRGLCVEKAIRKVKTDLEIGRNAMMARYDNWDLYEAKENLNDF